METGATAVCISCHAFLRWMMPRLSHIFWCNICLDSHTLECKGSTLVSVRGEDFKMRDILELKCPLLSSVYICVSLANLIKFSYHYLVNSRRILLTSSLRIADLVNKV